MLQYTSWHAAQLIITASKILYNVNERRTEKLHGWDQMDLKLKKYSFWRF